MFVSLRVLLTSAFLLSACAFGCTSLRSDPAAEAAFERADAPLDLNTVPPEAATGIRIHTPSSWSLAIGPDGAGVGGFTSLGAFAPTGTYSTPDVLLALRPSLKRKPTSGGDYKVLLNEGGEWTNYYTSDDAVVRGLFETLRPALSASELEHWEINPPTLVAIRVWVPSGWSITIRTDGPADCRHPASSFDGLPQPTVIPTGTYSAHTLARVLRPMIREGQPNPERPYSVHIFDREDRYTPFSTNDAATVREVFENARPWLTEHQLEVWEDNPPLGQGEIRRRKAE